MTKGKSIFIDTTKCTACRGCQVACKQWNQRAAEKTVNWGSHQNPPDLSSNTWKLVRFNEVPGEEPIWYFFPDQCRHCMNPPCKDVADKKAKGAIVQDETTGAIIFNPKVKVKPADFKEIQEACPYNIPRFNTAAGMIAKCTMCSDRVKGGMLPACVKTCPTGAMSFGDRKEILEKAKKRLESIEGRYKEATLTDMEDVRIFYLLVDDPKKYYKHAVADNTIGSTRKMAFKGLGRPLA